MENIATDTERNILDAANIVFQQKGISGARMEEIAREAGVNKALLHYYFRSKEKLYERIFQEAFGRFFQKVAEVLGSDLPIDVKIYKVVDIYSNILLHNKNLPLFIMGGIRDNPELMAGIFKNRVSGPIRNLQLQLDEQYENGNIIRISVHEFFLNLASLVIFPFIARPLVKEVFDVDEDSFDQMIKDRRRRVPRMIIEMLKP